MDYFYTPPERILRDRLEITGDEFNHLVHVMRKTVGDDIRVVDGEGNAYDVTLTGVKKGTAVGTIKSSYRHHNEPEREVHLAAAVLKNPAKFDFLVEKVSEIGVLRIIPLVTERTIPHHAKGDRWQKLALAAMKQCGRSILPTVGELQTMADVLASVRSYDVAMVCHESSDISQTITNLLQTTSKRRSVLILIGPEGGFSAQEVEACITAGCSVVSLGPRRLRTETAAIVAAGLVLLQ